MLDYRCFLQKNVIDAEEALKFQRLFYVVVNK